MTRKEYLDKIVMIFNVDILSNDKLFASYDWCDKKCEAFLDKFKSDVKAIGLSISKPYHAYGIGNNNEYCIFLKEKDKDGFIIEKNIAKYHLVYGVYGGINSWIEDYDTGDEICGVHHAR